MKLTTVILSSLLACGAYAQASQFFIGGSFGIANDGEFEDGLQGDYLGSLELGVRNNFSNTYIDFSGEIYFTGTEFDAVVFDPTVGNVFTSNDFSSVGFMANVKTGYYVSDFFSFYGGFGLGVNNFTQETFVDGFGGVDDNDLQFAYQILAGVELNVTEQFSLNLQYRYLVTEDIDEIFGQEIGAPAIDDSFISIGARFYF